ncbi:UNVERIFIED_CONTAM: hypothetical protein RMT77_000857 [Armadillidium vulgare]
MEISSIWVVFLSSLVLSTVKGQLKYCYSCRSRGKLGDCRDPFLYNKTNLVPGVELAPCPSGWCSKTIEGDEYGEDHDLATERRCMQRIPPDNNPRCSEALYNHKKIFICFCQGSLCNGGSRRGTSVVFGILTTAFIGIISCLLLTI